MQGVWHAGTGERFKTKKALREALALGMEHVYIEATALIGREYDGRLDDAPNGKYYIVGPEPHVRKWYAAITVSGHVDEGTRKAVIE